MELRIGQKVTYPSQGVCLVEEIKRRTIGTNELKFYALRVLSDNSTILVPCSNADNVGIRPIISSIQCRQIIEMLSDDFEPVTCDWKSRSRQFSEKLATGDLFEAADVLKKLTYLSHGKKLSFREQTLLEKAKFLIVSEIANADKADEDDLRAEVEALVETACRCHHEPGHETAVAAVH